MRKDGYFKELVRAHNYSVPLELDCHLESVLNTVQVPYHLTTKLQTPEMITSVKAQDSGQFDPFQGYATPAKISSYYNMGASKGNSKSTQGVYSALGQYYSPNDLKTFQHIFGLPNQEVAKSIGNYSSDSKCVENPLNCAEGNLDIQYMMAASPGSPITFWYSDQSFSEWLMDVAAAPSPPLVLSISYAAHEDSMTQSELMAFSTEAIKLGVMGVTLVAASGDDGAVSDSVRDFGYSKCGYAAMFPASNPYVISVGASSVSVQHAYLI
jgi:tripeptidyl-peptidase-1